MEPIWWFDCGYILCWLDLKNISTVFQEQINFHVNLEPLLKIVRTPAAAARSVILIMCRMLRLAGAASWTRVMKPPSLTGAGAAVGWRGRGGGEGHRSAGSWHSPGQGPRCPGSPPPPPSGWVPSHSPSSSGRWTVRSGPLRRDRPRSPCPRYHKYHR